MSIILLASPGVVRAEGLIDTITNLAGESQTAVNAVVTVGLTAFVAFMTFRNGFSLARLIMSGLVAAICAWLVLGAGIFTFQEKVGTDLGAPAVPTAPAVTVLFGGVVDVVV